MSAKRYSLMLLIGIICCVCPRGASAQEKPSVSQSSTTETRNEETKKHEAKTGSQAESKKKPNLSKKDDKQTAATDKPKKQKSSTEQKRASKKKQENTRFVDRNGDGIHDGMEHRFRRKHQNAGSNKNTNNRGRHLRQQRRRGAEASSNKGMRGGVE